MAKLSSINKNNRRIKLSDKFFNKRSKLKKIKIFVCCTEQSGENICSNILSRMNIDKYQFDGVCGKQSEKYISNKIYDLSEFKSRAF